MAEDPEYRDGETTVKVTIVTEDGTKLLDTQTASFPFAVNYSGIKSETGKITFHYTNVKSVPGEGGEDSQPEEIREEKTIERTIEFTKER